MKRTTVVLPADLKARAARVARERGISFGELLRRSLEAEVALQGSPYDDPVFADKAVFEGPAPANLAADHDGYLYGEEE